MKQRFTITYRGNKLVFKLNDNQYYICQVTKPDGEKYYVTYHRTGIEAEWDELADAIYDMVRTIRGL